jgi:hypothetical protein
MAQVSTHRERPFTSGLRESRRGQNRRAGNLHEESHLVEPVMVETVKKENRTADKDRPPIEPGIPPVVWFGVRI